MKRGLYIHIPFCARKCHYCDFVITVKKDAETRKKYLSALALEIAHAREAHGRLAFDTLYLGGGTPSALGASEISSLVSLVREHFDFVPGGEFTIEMNPDDAERGLIEEYRRIGINRVSVGAQSMKDELLKRAGRIHTSDQIRRTMELLGRAGFANISLDFILNLPGQTVEDAAGSVRSGIELGASQIVLYDLDVHERTLFGAWRRRGMLPSSDEDGQRAMWQRADELLEAAGFSAYELSSYAKPGYESRHNLLYWHNEEYLGLGPGAFSYLRGVRYQFSSDVRKYFEKCFAGDWEPETADRLTEREKQIESFITGLRLKQGVDLSRFPLIAEETGEKVPRLQALGLLEREGEILRLSRNGRSVADRIFAELLPEPVREGKETS